VEFKKSKNSVVILASQHNPTVFLGNFLHASGIIKNDNEVKKESSIITPAFAQVLFINGDTIQVDPDRLKIEGNFGEAPFLKGICYMSALPHIACRAIGINFTYEISDFDLNNFVNWELKNKYKASGVNVIFENDNGNKSIVNFNHNIVKGITLANFNFEYLLKNIKFSDVSIDLLKERKKNIKKAEEVLNELLTEKK